MVRSPVAVVFLAGTMIACSGVSKPVSPPMAFCETPSVCNGGPTPTPGHSGHCAEALSDPVCAPAYQKALACVQAREACTTDGRTDIAVTDDACASEIAAAFNDPSCFAILDQDAGVGADDALDAGAPEVVAASTTTSAR